MAPSAGLLVALAGLGAGAVSVRQRDASAWKYRGQWQSPALRGDPCDCMSWAQVYQSNLSTCGKGLELSSTNGPLNKSKYCGAFFERIDQQVCVNAQAGGEGLGQWCYVSAKCEDLHGGRVPRKSKVAYKLCKPGVDDKLSEHSLEDLDYFARKHNMDLALVARMAYPLKKDMLWQNIEEFLLSGGEKRATLERQRVVGMKRPIIFNLYESPTPFYVVHGKAAYKVFNTDVSKKAVMLMRDPDQHAAMSDFRCVVGCPKWNASSAP